MFIGNQCKPSPTPHELLTDPQLQMCMLVPLLAILSDDDDLLLARSAKRISQRTIPSCIATCYLMCGATKLKAGRNSEQAVGLSLEDCREMQFKTLYVHTGCNFEAVLMLRLWSLECLGCILQGKGLLQAAPMPHVL